MRDTVSMKCRNCSEIEEIEAGTHGYAIARLANGYVWLNPTQYHRGAVFYVARRCVAELFELEVGTRSEHLLEMAAVAAAAQRAVGARKMNYEALGNGVPHLHWWLTPRHHDDPRPGVRSGKTSTSCVFYGRKERSSRARRQEEDP